jgi:hypothetical protein
VNYARAFSIFIVDIDFDELWTSELECILSNSFQIEKRFTEETLDSYWGRVTDFFLTKEKIASVAVVIIFGMGCEKG